MQKASVGRPRAGGTRKNRSRAAAYALFAAKIAGWKQAEFDERFRELGVAFSESEARASARALRQELAPRQPFRSWLLVDEDALGLETLLITFPGAGRDRSDLVNALAGLEGIRQIVQGEATGTIVAVAVVRDRDERRHLRARLREASDEDFAFEPVLRETHEPAGRTWRALARREAAEEGHAPP